MLEEQAPLTDDARAFPEATLGVTAEALARSAAMRRYGLTFAPRTAPGRGRGIAYRDDELRELYQVARTLGGAARASFCRTYGVNYQTLARRARQTARSNGADRPATSVASVPAALDRPRFRSRAELLRWLEGRVETLAAELDEARRRLENLRQLDERDFDELARLIAAR